MAPDNESEFEGGGQGNRTKSQLHVVPLDAAWNDARKICKNEGQLAYIGDLFDRLEDFGNREATSDLKIVRVLGQIWKLEVKGFVLADICMGICFAHVSDRDEVVVLGVVRLDEGNALKQHQVIKMKRRLTYYIQEIAQ